MTIHSILENEFGLQKVAIQLLDGYANKNYLVTSAQGKFIFKSYAQHKELLEVTDAENEMLLHLQKKGIRSIPRPIAFSNGAFVKVLIIEGKELLCRLLTFVPGNFMGDVSLNETLIHSLGHFSAELTKALADFDHVALRAKKCEWDLQYVLLNKKYSTAISSNKQRNLVAYFFQQYEELVLPKLPTLRKGALHNDLNEWNILTNRGEVSGVIDFGDCTHSHVINEVAIMATYVFYASEKPLDYASTLLSSYHSAFPLKENEISILYWLIAMRLCTSVCNAAHAKRNDPKNEYATISEKKAWKLLEQWMQLGPTQVENTFRKALHFPVKKAKSVASVLKQRESYLSKTLSVSYQKPILMERAAFQYMFDVQGNSFLDAYNNIPHVGHQHPKVIEAAQQQMKQLNTNTRYLYDILPQYAEALVSKFPPILNKVFFVNSGSAASDLAIRLAKNYTKRQHILVMEHGYHGNTQIGIDISHYKFNNPRGQGQASYILKTELPDTYRGKYTNSNEDAGKLFAQDAIKNLLGFPEPIAAFITEPIVGCGGQIPLAKGYLKPLYKAVREHGGVCISDEVQTGFGRLGDVFWGFEQQHVVPDIVVLGKPMGNGHPIGAVVTTSEIASSFEEGVEFFSSFGGNPVSCAIGKAVLDTIKEEELQKNALEVGNYYQKCLRELQRHFPHVGDIRGSGLFLGIDIVKPESTTPDATLAKEIKNTLREKHILVSTDGPADNVIKSKPPLCFTKQNVDEVIGRIENILFNLYSS